MNHSSPSALRQSAQRSVVVVGASAGGVEALMALVAELPTTFPAAIVVVLHIPADAPSKLYQILEKAGSLPATQAVDGEPICDGHIYVASPDHHLMIDQDRLRLTRGPKENRSRPSVNVLFRSAAYSFGTRAIGVILSGMLDDGTSGLWAIKDAGGVALVQSPTDALYPSMPESACEHVLLDAVLPVAAIPAALVKRINEWGEAERVPLISHSLTVEHKIALGGNALQEGVMQLGSISANTCPECHGVLVQIQEGSIVRFRCHTGHAYSLKDLLSKVTEAIDDNLWNAIRAVEERIFLLHQLEQTAQPAAEVAQQIHHAEQWADQLRRLVLGSDELVHNFPEHSDLEVIK